MPSPHEQFHSDQDSKSDENSVKGLHRIEDDLADTWLEDWAGAGVADIEVFLGKHAAFLAFLNGEKNPADSSGESAA